MDIKFEFKEGSRAGCSTLLYTPDDNQIYVKNRQLKEGDIAYVCRIKDCKARVHLSADKTRLYSKTEQVQHFHGPQGQEMQKIEVLSEVKKKCQSSSNNDTKKVFNDVLAEKTEGQAEIEVNYDTVDIQVFLARTVGLNETFSKQDLFSGMCSDLNSSTSSSSSSSNLSQLSDSLFIQQNPCNVCLMNPKSVMLRPCNHVNICSTCWDQLVDNHEQNGIETNPKCPTCQQEVEEAIKNVYIYN
ncbi:probable E3 ubiquitin-protein ligase LUL3 [Drosophila yakuba]|uniref:probable E3 ubiquitin-protein ligase LUL3 n=1 Tax=Drosophila yakuba TaxID=7245 RepID=UPI00193075AB|nr:probable E3 ubiquitin-protein ligase LUL3 [Drosophila yakuba]